MRGLGDGAIRGLEIKPVILVEGEERILVDEAVRSIQDAVLAAGARDFNFDKFSAKDALLARILDAARTLPAFAKRRLVLVDHADKLSLEDAGPLLEYLGDPCPSTVLLFVAEKLDARTKVYKAFVRAGAVMRFPRPKSKEMPDFVRQRAKRIPVGIDEAAVRALVECVGADASGVIQALDVLALYIGPSSGRSIAVADVEAVVSTTREESVFALVDAIGKQNRPQALRGIDTMLSMAREPPLRVLAMIARHWRNLIKARSLLDDGAQRSEIEAAVGVPPFFLDGLLQQARRQPLPALILGLGLIARADQDLKGGRLDPIRAMERLILALMRGGVSPVAPS